MKNINLLLTVLEAIKSKIKVLVKVYFLIHEWHHLIASSHGGRGERDGRG
jgi:hypothetical protein